MVMETQKSSIDTAGEVVIIKAKPVRRVFKGAPRSNNKIPQSLIDDSQLNEAIAALPANYNFEIHKTIWRARESKATRIALQLPEGNIAYTHHTCYRIATKRVYPT